MQAIYLGPEGLRFIRELLAMLATPMASNLRLEISDTSEDFLSTETPCLFMFFTATRFSLLPSGRLGLFRAAIIRDHGVVSHRNQNQLATSGLPELRKPKRPIVSVSVLFCPAQVCPTNSSTFAILAAAFFNVTSTRQCGPRWAISVHVSMVARRACKLPRRNIGRPHCSALTSAGGSGSRAGQRPKTRSSWPTKRLRLP